jgi:hypothetical protein
MIHPADSRQMRALRSRSRVGAILLETIIAMGVIAIFLSGVYAANSRVWGLLRASLESNAASRVINGRAEQLRGLKWEQVTDPGVLAVEVFAVAPDSGGELAALNEVIDVIGYPSPSPVPAPISVVRDSSGTVTTPLAGDATMFMQPSVRVTLTANWTAKGGQPHVRQYSMIFAQGGVTGRK